MQDRPTLDELLEAVAGFLEQEVLPTLGDARLRFRTLVALNALGIARRELADEARHVAADLHDLARLLGHAPPAPGRAGVEALLRELAARIRAGQAPPDTLPALQQLVRRKLLVASPNYLRRYP
ncbi:MAG TPA: DUF6285 domain-containing protein [Chloroflexota bacterium]|jgi:hypothetical protein|nr:DUF6285 domain-containing protein [Chloroflexota bacterium]